MSRIAAEGWSEYHTLIVGYDVKVKRADFFAVRGDLELNVGSLWTEGAHVDDIPAVSAGLTQESNRQLCCSVVLVRRKFASSHTCCSIRYCETSVKRLWAA